MRGSPGVAGARGAGSARLKGSDFNYKDVAEEGDVDNEDILAELDGTGRLS